MELEIPEKLQWIITIAGLVLIIIGPLVTLNAFAAYQDTCVLGVIFSTLSFIMSNNL